MFTRNAFLGRIHHFHAKEISGMSATLWLFNLNLVIGCIPQQKSFFKASSWQITSRKLTNPTHAFNRMLLCVKRSHLKKLLIKKETFQWGGGVPSDILVRDCVSCSFFIHQRQYLLHFRSQLTNGSLYINSVVEGQRLTGIYQCMATLPNVGSIVSRTAKLDIASKFPVS